METNQEDSQTRSPYSPNSSLNNSLASNDISSDQNSHEPNVLRLSEILKNYELKFRRQQIDNRNLQKKLDGAIGDQKDVLEYKNQLIDQKEKMIQSLKESLERLKEESSQEIAYWEKSLEKIKEDFNSYSKDKETQLEKYKAKLSSVQIYLNEKDNMQEKIAKLIEINNNLKLEFEHKLHERDIKNIENIKRLREKMIENLDSAQKSFQEQLDNEVFESAKAFVSKLNDQENVVDRSSKNLDERSRSVEEKEAKLHHKFIKFDSYIERDKIMAKELQKAKNEIACLKTVTKELKNSNKFLRNTVEEKSKHLTEQKDSLIKDKDKSEQEIIDAYSLVKNKDSDNRNLKNYICTLKRDIRDLIEKMICSNEDNLNFDGHFYKKITSLLLRK